MDDDDRPSWFGVTLTDEPLALDEDLDGLSADLDHLAKQLRRYKSESDKPPQDEPGMTSP